MVMTSREHYPRWSASVSPSPPAIFRAELLVTAGPDGRKHSAKLALMAPESLDSLRVSLIALDLLDLPALPTANLLDALIRSKSG